MPIDDIPTCIVYVNSFTLLLKLEVGISAHFSGTVFATPTSVRPSREMSSVINCCTIYEVKNAESTRTVGLELIETGARSWWRLISD